MLAELAAANAAFAVIKATINNGQEIVDAGQHLVKYFGAKQQIQAKAHEKGYKSDLEAFMAAETLKAQEDELKQMMIYQGRAGMWEDWLQFQAHAKQDRLARERQEASKRLKNKKLIVDSCLAGVVVIFIVGITTSLVMLFASL